MIASTFFNTESDESEREVIVQCGPKGKDRTWWETDKLEGGQQTNALKSG